MASVALPSPGQVTGTGYLCRHYAVHPDEPAWQRPRDGDRVVEPSAVQHRTWATPSDTEHGENRRPAEPLGLGDGLRLAEAVHERAAAGALEHHM